MNFITLHRPIASSGLLERVHLFAGRHLGEEEFERQQAYADARLAPLLNNRRPGIVSGLGLESSNGGGLTAHENFIVNPGLGITAKGQTINVMMPLRAEWQAIIDHYLTITATDDATGVYYLTLNQELNSIDSPTTEPCQRTEFDPSRDSRLVPVTSVQLRRLAIAPEQVLSSPAELLQNRIVADRVDGEFLKTFGQSLPLALLAIVTSGSTHTVQWVSEAAGRYLSKEGSGYKVLLNQSVEAMRRVMLTYAGITGPKPELETYLQNTLHLRYLPAAGQLPELMLTGVDTNRPDMSWLPSHIGMDMVVVPTDSVAELIERHLPRRVIDLQQPAADKIRLLLALDRKDYRPDLLDIPPVDSRLEDDIYGYHKKTYTAWYRWRKQFNALYYILPSEEEPLTSPSELIAVEHRVLNMVQLKQLDLPRPTLPPILPQNLFTRIRDKALRELQIVDTLIPYPYDRPVPAAPDHYRNWLVDVDGEQVPPPVPDPDEDGLVIQYAVALVDLEAIENQIRAIRTRLEKTRDLLLLQRQQLDTQTVALSSLAGGVAGDGNGMQVARWLPYATLNTDLMPEELSAAAAATPAASAVVREAAATMTPLREATASSSPTKTFSSNLLASALNTSKASTPSYFTAKPQTYSAFELGINTKRLDLLANLAKSSISKPAYEAREFRFGVLDHISPEINEYRKAYFGMMDLITTINDLFDPTDAASLRKNLKATATKIGLVEPGVLENQIDARAEELAGDDSSKIEKLRGLVANQKRYEALFNAGKVLTRWVSIVESRYNKIERKLQGKLREHTRKLAQIEKLGGLIRVARETLENLDRVFDEKLGDYGVAQRLLEEDWRGAHDASQQRSRILTTGLQGLFYVRVRNSPVSLPLADPLELRHKGSEDIIPGCDWETDATLPEELDTFFDAIREMPMHNWASLKQHIPLLPSISQYTYLHQLRQARFTARPQKGYAIPATEAATPLGARLKTVHTQTQPLFKTWGNLSLPSSTTSSLTNQHLAAKVLSLVDINQAKNSRLRREAHLLLERLEQCQACLLEKLTLLPGSLRLQWGQLAEDDRIRVEEVSRWPGLDQAEQDDFNTARTIAELINWWFRQLASDAESSARSAMRNMIRATLIFSSLGDPQEIVRGSVMVPPRLVHAGERFKVKLNRQVQPGITLQLMDSNQQITAELTVEDHSEDATQVRISKAIQTEVKINTSFLVVGKVR